MKGSLFIGDLDSEKYWRDENLAKLPAVNDEGSLGIILAMDELLFPFCMKDDLLITRFVFDQVLKEYLGSIGFEFRCNIRNYHTDNADAGKTIFEIIAGDKSKLSDFIHDTKGVSYYSPYSIVPYTDVLADKVHFENRIAAFQTVKKVNSKEYSTILGKRLGFGEYGEVVNSIPKLFEKGKEFLNQGAFLIKDVYGVSGKGNILVNSRNMLERIVKYIESWVTKGKACMFILERLLDKKLDFSCSLTIDENGKVVILGIQKMINRQFAYGGSETADEQFIRFLTEQKYFDTVYEIAGQLYRDGYFGDVCIDSMLLKSGEIAPIIEINARKSMGFVNNKIDSYLAKIGLKGSLMNINVGVPNKLTFADILTKLKQDQIVFSNARESGILPVSANTLFINQQLCKNVSTSPLHKGRMYFSVVSKNAGEKEQLLRNLVTALEGLSCKVYSKV